MDNDKRTLDTKETGDIMGEQPLWDMFLEQTVENLQTVILRVGIDGLLKAYETWLYQHDLIDREMVTQHREAPDEQR